MASPCFGDTMKLTEKEKEKEKVTYTATQRNGKIRTNRITSGQGLIKLMHSFACTNIFAELFVQTWMFGTGTSFDL